MSTRARSRRAKPAVGRNAWRLDNFKLAQRRDGALREDKLWSMRTLKNFDVIYTDGRVRVRPGYDRWNDTIMLGSAQQLYHFIDSALNDHLMAVVDTSGGRWYVVKETGAHVLLSAETTTARKPVTTFGDRAFFATDSGVHWTDDASIGGATKSFRMGIKKPAEPPTLRAIASEGNYGAALGGEAPINPATAQRIGIKYTPTLNQWVGSVHVSLRQYDFEAYSGAIKGVWYTDAAGEPSGTLADDNAVSAWVAASTMTSGGHNYVEFPFPDKFVLTGATDYWLVLEGDDAYFSNYSIGARHVTVGYESIPPAATYAASLGYWPGLAAWVAMVGEAKFRLGYLADTQVYDYVYTYVNTTYGIESRPSAAARIEATVAKPVVYIQGYSTTSDGQVDAIRFYRREVPDLGSVESAITDTYKLVSEVPIWQAHYDMMRTGLLGGELQSQDHYCWDDTDDDSTELRTETILPAGIVPWKDRLWIWESQGNVLHMTKTLEVVGATGLANDPIPDFIPLENKLELPVPSSIIAAHVISDDQLVVFFRDESIWIIGGSDSSLNPPPDLRFREFSAGRGLIAPASIGKLGPRSVHLSRDGLYALPLMELMSETNASILDAVDNAHIDDSIVMVYGNEIWILIDSDNDDDLDTILILDMQRDIPTRNLFDRAWRMYQYDVNLNDIVVRKTGSTFRTVLAAQAAAPYILELGVGTTDNGAAITAELETHDFRARNMSMVFGLDWDAYYPGAVPGFTITLTDHAGTTNVYTRTPTSSNDVRLHHVGTRMHSPVSVRAKLEMLSTDADELLSMEIGYKGE